MKKRTPQEEANIKAAIAAIADKDPRRMRIQSPKAENIMRLAIHDAVQAALEIGHLYVNQRIDLAPITALAGADVTAKALEDEFLHRPWTPFSRKRPEREWSASDPLGTDAREMRLTFLLPTIEAWCQTCDKLTTHNSIPHIEISPYHAITDASNEPLGYQTFLLNYQCDVCHAAPVTFMLRRELNKVQLSGRSSPHFRPAPPQIPKALRRIYSDAIGATACNDIPAAFYHWRTLMEHQMKLAMKLPLESQITGEDLCDQYNAQCDPVVRDRASFKDSVTLCSKNLHARTGDIAEAEKVRALIENHFALLATLAALTP